MTHDASHECRAHGHDHTHPATLQEHRRLASRLHRFWGRVAAMQDDWLADIASGVTVLEVGCGYGAMVGRLRSRGMAAYGIDADPLSLQAGREMLGPLPLIRGDAYQLPFGDRMFDTIIFRDSLHHLDVDQALAEAERLSRGRVIVFEPNLMPLLRFARGLVGHAKHEELPLHAALEALRRRGWMVERVLYRDLIALPLSGGYIGPELMQPLRPAWTLLLAFDDFMTRAVHATRLSSWLCWRYAIVAQPARPRRTAK